jgi:hypothetical protein
VHAAIAQHQAVGRALGLVFIPVRVFIPRPQSQHSQAWRRGLGQLGHVGKTHRQGAGQIAHQGAEETLAGGAGGGFHDQLELLLRLAPLGGVHGCTVQAQQLSAGVEFRLQADFKGAAAQLDRQLLGLTPQTKPDGLQQLGELLQTIADRPTLIAAFGAGANTSAHAQHSGRVHLEQQHLAAQQQLRQPERSGARAGLPAHQDADRPRTRINASTERKNARNALQIPRVKEVERHPAGPADRRRGEGGRQLLGHSLGQLLEQIRAGHQAATEGPFHGTQGSR